MEREMAHRPQREGSPLKIEGRYGKSYGLGADVCWLVMRNRCGEPERDRVETNLERTKEKPWCVCE